jgi:protein-tyrosine phosphatase
MVDIHCHILPGLDDGPDSIELSLQMAEMAISEGITHIVATPHANSEFAFIPELIRQRRDEIQAQVGDHLTLATGCDFHLSFENLQDIQANPTKYTINQKKYLLVEFADYSIPPSIDKNLHELQLAGIKPIITHPERNPLIRSQPERLLRWVQQGCYVQVTAQSLAGRFGGSAKAAADRLLEFNVVHFIASDAHNVTGRPLRLKDVFELVAERKGEEIAQSLLQDNPLAAFLGAALPYLPDPPETSRAAQLEVSRQEHFHDRQRKKRFLFF